MQPPVDLLHNPVEYGVWDIPIVLAASLEPQRAALRNTLLAAQRRLTAFALKHDWRTMSRNRLPGCTTYMQTRHRSTMTS